MDPRKALWMASGVFAPSYPRRCASRTNVQSWQKSRAALVDSLDAASKNGMPGYYSVYSFPRGHPQEGNIPDIDCVFIDLDVTGDHYDPDNPSFGDWRADMSALLTRARMMAQALMDSGHAEHFRVVLSGHKGIHLYLDFETLPVEEAGGDIRKFKAGLRKYGEEVMAWLDGIAGGINIEPWVDVDGSDLARLARHPNTVHHGAVQDDTLRWAVPVTVEELASLTWEDYLDYTEDPRWPNVERVPSENAYKAASMKVRNARPGGVQTSNSRRKKSSGKALKDYKERANDDIELGDVLFLTENKPCFKSFRQRGDAFNHGESSRVMELSIMGRLLSMDVPLGVVHEFFEPIPGYDEDYTNAILGDLLARGNEYGEFNCETVCEQAPQFCLGDSCSIYRRSDDLQK